MTANQELQSFHSIVLNDEPQFQGTKSAAQRDVPVAVIEDPSCFAGLIAQIFGCDAEAVSQSFTVSDVEAGAVEIREHPFVRVETIAIGEFEGVLKVTKLRAQRGGAGHGRIHMQPDAMFLADFSDGGKWIESQRRCGANCGTYKERNAARSFVFFDCQFEEFRAHAKLIVNADQTQIGAADARDFFVLLD